MSLFSSAVNPYDSIVVNATDENLTSENWELIINLVDKVTEEGEQGARNVIASILKRLAHRIPNVQLYSLSLAEALSKNCGKQLHAEIASRAFTQGLEKLITDRTTNDKVRRKALQLIGIWTQEWENDPTLGLMEECYKSLRAKNYSFDTPDEPPPPQVDDEVRRREEEELQRALEISMNDKGGRQQWTQYSLASSSGAGTSGSSGQAVASNVSTSGSSSVARADTMPSYSGGYIPSANSSIQPHSQPPVPAQPIASATSSAVPDSPSSATLSSSTSGPVTRVRALHTFEPSEAGELAFERGDIIRVVDRGYKDWWRGQLKGRTGIFPVNYVEPLPEPTVTELAAEAQQEAGVFAQATNVDRLLAMLRQMDPTKDNLADNEEIQELYRSSMALRPKIVKLIDKYSQKRADLVAMNESFVKARTIFDRMMEESLARHSSYYEQRPAYGPDPRVAYGPDSQSPGWNPPASTTGYDPQAYTYPTPPGPYSPPLDSQFGRPQLVHQESFPSSGPQQTLGPYPQQYSSQDPHTSLYGHSQPAVSPQPQTEPYQQPPASSQLVPQSPQPLARSQYQAQYQAQPQAAPEPASQQPAQQTLIQQELAPLATAQGPPYVFDPSATYPDPNAQAWAQYYAAGGDDPTGSVYFISVPGIKPPPSTQGVGSPTRVAAEAAPTRTDVQQQAQASQTSLAGSQGSTHEQSLPLSSQAQNTFVQAIQQQQQGLQQHGAPLDQPPQADVRHQSSLPDPYDASSTVRRQGSLPNPYGQVAYGQSPYPPQQYPQDASQVHGLQAQFSGLHVSEGQSPPAPA